MIDKTTNNNQNNVFFEGVRAAVPIAMAYFAVSFAFGLMGTEGGLPPHLTVMISALNLTSAGQFAGLNVMLAHGSFAELALTQLVINLRYSLMSFSLSQKIEEKASVPARLALSFGITDEIFAVTSAREGRVSPSFVYGAIACAWPGWVLGTLSGAVLGSVLPEMVLKSLSVALYGMFIAIVMPEAVKSKAVAFAALFAAGVSTLFAVLPFLRQVSGGFVIIIATVVTAALAAALFPLPSEEQT